MIIYPFCFRALFLRRTRGIFFESVHVQADGQGMLSEMFLFYFIIQVRFRRITRLIGLLVFLNPV